MEARLRTAVAAICLIVWMAVPTCAQAAFPGKNGKLLIDVTPLRDHTDEPYVAVIDPNGTGLTLLTDPDYADSGHASPDGQKITWLCDSFYICTMNVDGSSKAKIYSSSVTSPGSYSPDGSKIAFGKASHISVINTDGSGFVDLGATGKDPVWSPDGTRIAFDSGSGSQSEIFVMNADGTNVQPVTSDPADDDGMPSWSPDGTKIAFAKGAALTYNGSADIYFIRPDGSGETRLTTTSDANLHPAWSPDGTKIAFSSDRDHVLWDFGPPAWEIFELYVMNSDGSAPTRITHEDLNPLGERNSYGSPDWQPIPINTYPRPRGASPFRVSLVPANSACAVPNETHGAPLAFSSCNPPALSSQHLTTGTPDSNGLPVKMDASLLLKVMAGNSSTPADEADVEITAEVNDVMKKDLTDYTGGLRAELPLRITDRDNTPSPVPHGAGSTRPFEYGFNIPCTPDPDPVIGSDCSISTTADTLVPGTIKEGLRTVWQIGRARVDDGGADGDPSTTGDNTVFAVQGLFVP